MGGGINHLTAFKSLVNLRNKFDIDPHDLDQYFVRLR